MLKGLKQPINVGKYRSEILSVAGMVLDLAFELYNLSKQ